MNAEDLEEKTQFIAFHWGSCEPGTEGIRCLTFSCATRTLKLKKPMMALNEGGVSHEAGRGQGLSDGLQSSKTGKGHIPSGLLLAGICTVPGIRSEMQQQSLAIFSSARSCSEW